MDEVFFKINDKQYDLWRAIEQDENQKLYQSWLRGEDGAPYTSSVSSLAVALPVAGTF